MEVKVPPVGESITTGVLVSWLKKDGEAVKEGDPIFELETDKAVVEVPAPAAGTLRILVKAGADVAVGQAVAELSAAGLEPAARPKEDAPAHKKEVPAAQKPAPAEGKPPVERKPAASAPAARPSSDCAGKDRPPPERVPMTTIRRKTAERLVLAQRTAAYLSTFNEIDMLKVMDIRAHYKAEFAKGHGIKIGLTSFFVKACCQALKEFPAVNAQVDGDDILYHRTYDIGVAVAIERGLLVPVIRGADALHFADIETAVADLAKRAQEKKLSPDELAGGTFSITNGGVFGSLLSTPIPAYPQSAILGMHAIKKRPVVVNDEVVVRPMMYVALTYDHRVIDGREAVGFLARVKDFIEDPDKLLLEL